MERRTTFRGEAVLKLRKHREAGAKQSFAAARAALETIDARIASLQQAMEAYDAEARQAIRRGAGAAALGTYRHCVAGIRQALVDEQRRRAVAADTLQRRRKDLLAAREQRQALSRLKDRIAGRAATAQQRTETKQRDDLYVAHAAGRKRA